LPDEEVPNLVTIRNQVELNLVGTAMFGVFLVSASLEATCSSMAIKFKVFLIRNET